MRRSLRLCAGLGWVMLASCVTGVGYERGGRFGYSPGYLQPYGYEYGGWGSGYVVGPGRGGERREPSSSHGYRSAPQTRPTPSIPRAPRDDRGDRGDDDHGGHR